MASNLETKIDRIATAVTSALSALTAKGVTVPAGANVESLAALIESIEAGGGGGGGSVEPFSEIVTGTVTVSRIGTTMPIPTLSNLLAVFAIRIGAWGATSNLGSRVIQAMFVSNSLNFGYYSKSFSNCIFYDSKLDELSTQPNLQSIGDGEVQTTSGYWIEGTYWYACICGNKT